MRLPHENRLSSQYEKPNGNTPGIGAMTEPTPDQFVPYRNRRRAAVVAEWAWRLSLLAVAVWLVVVVESGLTAIRGGLNVR